MAEMPETKHGFPEIFMRIFQKAFLLGLAPVLALALASFFQLPASAYQVFYTYRIAGSDILEVSEGDHVEEDPLVLSLTLNIGSGQTTSLAIETDGDIEECKLQLETIMGSNSAYAEIVVDMNAQTMNGVLMIQCAVFHGLFPEKQ
ncbi:hypothetical protein SIAM614_20545 [Stappia aggregata IAM 12614]|uniref:Uncharacterized protein n=2 Tax=Roseibium aggregatum TaxID=187304 RepID=A0NYC0_ROSAI|nr:hypothetical protein SIAM614_20545 [Stappia aggregata IAM 12614] [Roseibium aggregatum IAM 12614]